MPRQPSTGNLQPIWPAWDQLDFTIFGRFMSALLGVIWAYHGWMNIAPVAEEVTNPQRNTPLALLVGVGTLIALYLGTNLSYSLVLTQAEMKASPLSLKAMPQGLLVPSQKIWNSFVRG